MWSYLFDIFPDEFKIIILDIGASLYERPSYKELVDAGRAQIIGFEPNFEECGRLTREYGAGGRHRFYPYFVGDGQKATYHETNWAPTGSLYEPNTPLLEKFQTLAEMTTPVAKHIVSTSRIDDIAEIDDVDFIKIDVQGGELAIFENAKRILSQTLLIQTEVAFVEMYKGQPMFADIDKFLRANGFQFHSMPGMATRAFKPLVNNGDMNSGFHQGLWTDVFYVRDWMNLENLAEMKLRKYAVLADMLESYDLAYLVLSVLDRKTGGHFAKPYLERLRDEKNISTSD